VFFSDTRFFLIVFIVIFFSMAITIQIPFIAGDVTKVVVVAILAKGIYLEFDLGVSLHIRFNYRIYPSDNGERDGKKTTSTKNQ
jgi:hypothetical protein